MNWTTASSLPKVTWFSLLHCIKNIGRNLASTPTHPSSSSEIRSSGRRHDPATTASGQAKHSRQTVDREPPMLVRTIKRGNRGASWCHFPRPLPTDIKGTLTYRRSASRSIWSFDLCSILFYFIRKDLRMEGLQMIGQRHLMSNKENRKNSNSKWETQYDQVRIVTYLDRAAALGLEPNREATGEATNRRSLSLTQRASDMVQVCVCRYTVVQDGKLFEQLQILYKYSKFQLNLISI